MRVLFVESPKDYWFVMGEYLPPPYGILQLAAFLEREAKEVDIEVVDCQASHLDWDGLRKRIESLSPDILASSSLATCNAYTAVRALETAKKVNPDILTIVGGQHFTATAQESLEAYPEIDVIIRGEGELTLVELVRAYAKGEPFTAIDGISFRKGGGIAHNPPRALIEDLDDLPFPGYHFVKDVVGEYHFSMMAGPKTSYALIEGGRGCTHRCTFCSQWRHWNGRCRVKSPDRIAEEMEFCYREYGSKFIWLTDDNFGLDEWTSELTDGIVRRGISDEIMWFTQARCDDVVRHRELLPKMRDSGLRWVLLGAESNSPSTLGAYNKGIRPGDIKEAVKLLKENDIFAHTMFIIGEREDTAASIAELRGFVNDLDPDLAIFGVLTPFPGTEVYERAERNGWIEDRNWANYDMVHAIMPTETLSRSDVQEELYGCYRGFYGSWGRRFRGLFSPNEMTRKINWFMATGGVMRQLRDLF
jgi:anaerobic magnesium-protoporphyrin IX monomethyl ester cyclase